MEEIRVEEESVSAIMSSGTPIPGCGDELSGIRLQIIPFIFKNFRNSKIQYFPVFHYFQHHP